KVECGRCALVFEATAPAKVEMPPQTPATPVPRASDPGALERRASADELARALKPRRPGDSLAVAPKRSPIWIVALGGLMLVGVGALVTYARLGGLPAEAQARMEKARDRLLRDDSASLAQATALFTEAARLAPGESAPEAERAFALLLQAATHKDLASRIGALLKENPPEPDRLAQEREQHALAATRRMQEGLAAARAALEDDEQDPVALRATALHAALTDL